MNKRRNGRSRQPARKKKAYRAPELIVCGNIRALTQRKKGVRNDGFGKPRTRASGGNA